MKHLLLTTIAAVVLVGCGGPSIRDAAWEGDIETVKQHLAAGTDVNAKRGDGFTPLHLAATWGYKEIIELLIAAGADVNAKTKYGSTPLDLGKGKKEISDLLRKHGGKTGEELIAEGK